MRTRYKTDALAAVREVAGLLKFLTLVAARRLQAVA